MTGSRIVTTSTWSVTGLGFALAVVVLWGWACTGGASDDDDGPSMGSEGGICRLDETCNAGLTCVSGRCVDLTAADAGGDGGDAGADVDTRDTQTDPDTSSDAEPDAAPDVALDVTDAGTDPLESCAFYYDDGDEDGAGGGPPVWVCSPNPSPPGWVTDGSDCDDKNPEVHPGIDADRPDGLDNDCDQDVDEDLCAWEPLAALPEDISGDGVGLGDTWRDLSFEDQCGGTSAMGDLYGAPTVLMVGALWCPPCNQAAGELAALQADAIDRVGSYFHVATYLLDGNEPGQAATAEDAGWWADEYNLVSPVWFGGESDELFRLAEIGVGGINALPSIWLIGPDLEVLRFEEGYPSIGTIESWLRAIE